MTSKHGKYTYPLQEWYQDTGLAKEFNHCAACRTIMSQGIQDDVAVSWAAFNTNHEIDLSDQLINHVENGGDIHEWAQKHWMFHYSRDLPGIEYQEIMQDIPDKGHFVHIGCGAIPFTGIFFSQYFDQVSLIDIDELACQQARHLIQALGIRNVTIHHINGKDFDMGENDTVMIASMVLNKEDILKTAAQNNVQNILMRSTDDRPRGIFYKKDHTVSGEYGYKYKKRTHPPLAIGNVTYRYKKFQK